MSKIIARYDAATGEIKHVAEFPDYAEIDGTVPYLEVPSRDPQYCVTHKVVEGKLVERAAGDVRPGRPAPEAAYVVSRRGAYPSLVDQLDAVWKGPDSPEFQAMQATVRAVKARYPKPQ